MFSLIPTYFCLQVLKLLEYKIYTIPSIALYHWNKVPNLSLAEKSFLESGCCPVSTLIFATGPLAFGSQAMFSLIALPLHVLVYLLGFLSWQGFPAYVGLGNFPPALFCLLEY